MARPFNGPNRHVTFYAQDFFNPSKHFAFDVLAGDQPPRIVGGYAQWQVVPRPLRRGLTIFQGYDPMSMEVAIRFIRFDQNGSWLQDTTTARKIDYDIAVLEWMAGESIDVGPSPLVWLSTFNGRGEAVPLIPFEYQSATSTTPKLFGGGDTAPWVVIGLDWDPDPIRNADGYRVRQDAKVTVQYYSAPGGNGQTQGNARKRATHFTSRGGADTALLIARREPTAYPAILAEVIRKAAQNKALNLRSVNTPIKHGKKVYVPSGN